MEKFLNKMTIAIGIVLVILSLILLGYLGFLTIYEYKPNQFLYITTENNQNEVVPLETPLTITTLNLGFGAYEPEFSYFFEDGEMTQAKNLDTIIDNLSMSLDAVLGTRPDIVLVQEVDSRATRSHYTSQISMIDRVLSSHSSSYTPIFVQKWLAYPFDDMHGITNSGTLTLTSHYISESLRVALPSSEVSWPMNIVSSVDPALTIHRMPTEGDRELVVIHLHLLDYSGGVDRTLFIQMLEVLEEIIMEEYSMKGNYVIVGGDFGYILENIVTDEEVSNHTANKLLDLYEFKWLIDTSKPTTVIDDKFYITSGFLVSRNVDVYSIKTIDTGLEFSKGNPVSMTFELD
ncbi:MAG: hypothetical protein ATN35_11280 [Epulopiscium sp. Nele67-Bin004]|nr:MAG: hypothetical protein ATN35_11280 [Epulopiscium sp. Nele67-Bin004]